MNFISFNLNIKLRLICGFFSRIFTMATIPYMAIYFSQYFSVLMTGYIIGISTILNILGTLIGGFLADYYDKKKIVTYGHFMNGLLLNLLGIFILLKIPNMVMILFYLSCLWSSLYKSSMSVILIDSTDITNRKVVYGYDYWFMNLSVAIGAIIAGFFFSNFVFILYFVSGIINIIISIIYKRYLLLVDKEKNRMKNIFSLFSEIFNSYAVVVKDIKYILFILSGTFIFSSEGHLTNFLSISLKEENIKYSFFFLTLDAIGIISSLQIINTIIIVCFTITISKITKKFNVKTNLLIGIILYTFSYSIMLSTRSFNGLILLAIIATIGELIFAPSYQVSQIEMMDYDNKGVYSAFGSIALQSSYIFSSIILILSTYFTKEKLTFLTIILSFLSMVCLLITYSKKQEKD